MSHRIQRAPVITGLLLVLGGTPAGSEIPLETTPSYISAADSHYATGGAWADVDGDGWPDMVVANGNDMSRQRVVIYHNNGDGTLPAHPTWSASDVDFHGHLDVGDIDGDGLLDVAVAVYLGPGGFGEPGGVKVYLNDGAGAFHAVPDWVSATPVYCFSVALGDADGDGDLDLACACGDDYDDHPERQRIFFNQGGALETTPSWQSSEIGYALDVTWDDVDGDGDLDVLFCGTSTPLRLYRNAQTAGGGIATAADWQNADLPQYGNTAAFGDWNGDGFPELAVADNNQLGGAGKFKVYANAGGALGAAPAWTSATGGYGSHVSWADLDLDGDADLFTGRWWSACRIYGNTGGALTTQPVWTSATYSVVENVFYGDLDRDGLRDTGRAIAGGDGRRTFFPLGTAPVASVDGVWVDGVGQPPSAYAAHLGQGWISLAAPPPPGTGNVRIHYSYSTDLDVGVTNWDPDIGNYVFYNQGIPTDAPAVAQAVRSLRALPNPMGPGTWLRYRGPRAAHASLRILDVGGRLVRVLHEGPIDGDPVTWHWDRRDEGGRRVPSGTYFARLAAGADAGVTRLVAID